MAAIKHAVAAYGLPGDLKLSIHSGSDKFSIYPAIHAAMGKFSTGVHLKTAGTTWLEEMIGLAEAGGKGLKLAKEIYAEAFSYSIDLCAPYATVIDIHPANCPRPRKWPAGPQRNSPLPCATISIRLPTTPACASCCTWDIKLRPGWGARYLDLLDANETIIAKNVTDNLFARHIAPVFLDRRGKQAR